MHKFNLLPAEILIEQSRAKRRFYFVFLAFFLFVLLVFSLIFIDNSRKSFEIEIYEISNEIIDLKTKLTGRSHIDKIKSDYEIRYKVYEALKKDQIGYGNILGQVLLSVSDDTAVTSLRFDSTKNLVLEGYCPTNYNVAQVMEELMNLNFVNDVNLGFSKNVEVENKSSRHFEIIITLKDV